MTDNTPRTSALTTFSFDSKEIRITDQNGDPWFILRDLLDAMESSTPVTVAVESIKEGLGDGFNVVKPILDSLGRSQNAIIVAEPAATYLLSRSNTEKGRKLNRFIHVEVLPAIRKTGFYAMPGAKPHHTIDLVTIRRDDLWTLTSGLAALKVLVEHGLTGVAAIEAATGQQWYGGRLLDTAPNAAQACLDFILNASLLVASEHWYGDATTRELIGVVRGRPSRGIPELDAVCTLARYGLRLEGEYLLVSNTNKDLAGVLRGTKWAVAWRKTLIQIQGAYKSPKPVYIGGHVSRYVAVPLARMEGA